MLQRWHNLEIILSLFVTFCLTLIINNYILVFHAIIDLLFGLDRRGAAATTRSPFITFQTFIV